MTFESQKTTTLQKQDKSKKGEIDDAIVSLVDCINEHPDFYTTSSCAGRILLITLPLSGRKDESSWVFSSHNEVSSKELIAALPSSSLWSSPLPPSSPPISPTMNGYVADPIWFRMEGFIVHVCCRSMEHACRMVSVARDAGVKRSGIISVGERITLELIDTEKMDCPITKNGVLVVSEEYLSYLVDCANKKLKKTREKIKKVKKAFEAFCVL